MQQLFKESESLSRRLDVFQSTNTQLEQTPVYSREWSEYSHQMSHVAYLLQVIMLSLKDAIVELSAQSTLTPRDTVKKTELKLIMASIQTRVNEFLSLPITSWPLVVEKHQRNSLEKLAAVAWKIFRKKPLVLPRERYLETLANLLTELKCVVGSSKVDEMRCVHLKFIQLLDRVFCPGDVLCHQCDKYIGVCESINGSDAW